MALKVTENSELFVHIGHNIVDHTIVSPGVSVGVKCNFTIVEDVIGCLSPFAQFAQITARLFPSLQVGRCGEGVNGGIEEKLEGSLLQVVHSALPHNVLLFGCCKGQKFSLNSQIFHMILPLLSPL